MTLSRRQFGLAALSSLTLFAAGCAADAPATTGSPAASGSAGTPNATTDTFPVTIEHTFGTTTIAAAPTKVAAAGFNEQDFVLAFGVVPVGVREFLGYDAPARPWAPTDVRGQKLTTFGSQEIDLEQVAALQPDLIMAVNAYIDEKTYTLLSAIAPTVAQPAKYADGATPWRDQTMITGQALGRSAEAAELVSTVDALFTQAKSDHPDLAGRSASFALGSSSSGTYLLGTDDYRTGWLTDLGLTVAAKGGEGDVSWERVDLLEADVLLIEGFAADDRKRSVFTALDVVREDRTVDLGAFDQDMAAAIGFNSPLSLSYVLEHAVPAIVAALDDDPATEPTLAR